MTYPTYLFKAYAAGVISRAAFILELSKLQGFDGHVTSSTQNGEILAHYRGRAGTLSGRLIAWKDAGKTRHAATIKEMKIKIDMFEMFQNYIDKSFNAGFLANDSAVNAADRTKPLKACNEYFKKAEGLKWIF